MSKGNILPSQEGVISDLKMKLYKVSSYTITNNQIFSLVKALAAGSQGKEHKVRALEGVRDCS